MNLKPCTCVTSLAQNRCRDWQQVGKVCSFPFTESKPAFSELSDYVGWEGTAEWPTLEESVNMLNKARNGDIYTVAQLLSITRFAKGSASDDVHRNCYAALLNGLKYLS